MKFLGIDIGGTNIDIVIFDRKFRHIATYSTSKHLKNLRDIIKNFLQHDIKALGIGAAIWIKRGKVVKAPNLPSLFKIYNEINGIPIVIDNDANCFALFAYHKFGYKNMLAITIGTGIGCGIVIDGKIYRGNGIAGEIGHWYIKGRRKCKCNGYGHLECFFSGWALKEKYGKDVKEIMDDKEFIYSTKEFVLFCQAIANATMLMNPSAIIFGGRIGINMNEKKLKDKIYSFMLPDFFPKIKILKDKFAVAKGACLMAMHFASP